eukprot:15361189-Ditylum_brightwellii.AAC.1
MMFMASATHINRAAEKIGERCLHFLNCETAALADKDLNTMFKTLGLHREGFAHSLVTRLYNGNFTYLDASTP